MGSARVTVDGEAQSQVALEAGTELRVGGHKLTVIDAPTGFDLALELEADRDISAAEFEAAYGTRLENTWLGKRRPAWILGILIVLLAFASPMLYRMAGFSNDGAGALIPSDELWTSGPLHPVHDATVAECSSCHINLFEKVPNEACTDCHRDVSDHMASTHPVFPESEQQADVAVHAAAVDQGWADDHQLDGPVGAGSIQPVLLP